MITLPNDLAIIATSAFLFPVELTVRHTLSPSGLLFRVGNARSLFSKRIDNSLRSLVTGTC